jgi:hypothetical protein
MLSLLFRLFLRFSGTAASRQRLASVPAASQAPPTT